MNFVIKLFFLFKTVKSRSLQNFRQQIFIKINWQNVSLVSSVFCNNVNKSWNHEYVSSDLRKEITWLRRDHNHRVRNLTTERDAATLLRLYFGLFFITVANRRLLNTNFFTINLITGLTHFIAVLWTRNNLQNSCSQCCHIATTKSKAENSRVFADSFNCQLSSVFPF